ncbi:MAG: thio(seleno)oxazole modification radical SAM maturase SbtM [Syntrophobacteraceae bacterium]
MFTLQWHLTNACPFSCKHCYDRSNRLELRLDEAMTVLDHFEAFCRRKRVEGRISLTGGDPLFYPFFWDLYGAIARKKFQISILGNPISIDDIKRLLNIQKPLYYQVSLEGLKENNDDMRGFGHFERVISFLKKAEDLGLRTHVMLTLTRANLQDVIPLGEFLRDLAYRFTFNRLSRTGEAVSMEMPTKGEYIEFLKQYILAAKSNSIFGFKDNLFNVIRHQLGRPLMAGCTGAGCGAAFNFVALLPDGEVHACRKFPSPIGNIDTMSLIEIYESAGAKRYRQGPAGCRKCSIRNSCGGCPAVTYGFGLDPLGDVDPYCFLDEREQAMS